MNRFYLIIGILFIFFISSCGVKVINITNGLTLNKEKKFAVIPFENFTDTPLAGCSVASIVEGILYSRGYKLQTKVWSIPKTEPSKKDIEKIKEKAIEMGAEFIVMGSVNEFRYKTGIDGEPAVSLTLLLYDAKAQKVVTGSTASATGWANESLGTIAQKLINKVIK
ncbi:pellicle/biofilm biosynthesis outer membrane protein PelC [Desulfothermus okinawensis JCM 13304]